MEGKDKIQVIYNNLSKEQRDIVDNLYSEAFKIIRKNFIIDRHITIIFFNKELRYKFINETYGNWMPNLLLFEIIKLLTLDKDRQIVIILEEFCHCLLNSFDEELVGEKVAEIYDNVSWDKENKRYNFI